MAPQLSGKRPRVATADADEQLHDARSAGVFAASKEPQSTTKSSRKQRKKRLPPAATAMASVQEPRRPTVVWRKRDQENSLLYNVQLDVAALQSEVQRLQQYRNMLMQRVLNREDGEDGSCVKLVRKYFLMFKNGYVLPTAARANAGATNTVRTASVVSILDEFCRQVVDAKVDIGRFSGVQHLVKQCMRYSALFGPMQFTFLDSFVFTNDHADLTGDRQVLVTARANYHGYISKRTIEYMFPNAPDKQEIASRILGRRITGVGKFDFVVDTVTNRIVRKEFSLDLVSALINLLGFPVAAATYIRDAFVSDQYLIGEVAESYPPGPKATRIFEELDSSTSSESVDDMIEKEKKESSTLPSPPFGIKLDTDRERQSVSYTPRKKRRSEVSPSTSRPQRRPSDSPPSRLAFVSTPSDAQAHHMPQILSPRDTVIDTTGLSCRTSQRPPSAMVSSPVHVTFLDSSTHTTGAKHQHQVHPVSSSKQLAIDNLMRQHAAAKLLTRHLTGERTYGFGYESPRNRLLRKEASLDLFSSLVDLLGDPVEAATVLRDGLVSNQYLIDELSCLQPQVQRRRPSATERETPIPAEGVYVSVPSVRAGSPEEWKMKISSLLA